MSWWTNLNTLSCILLTLFPEFLLWNIYTKAQYENREIIYVFISILRLFWSICLYTVYKARNLLLDFLHICLTWYSKFSHRQYEHLEVWFCQTLKSLHFKFEFLLEGWSLLSSCISLRWISSNCYETLWNATKSVTKIIVSHSPLFFAPFFQHKMLKSIENLYSCTYFSGKTWWST